MSAVQTRRSLAAIGLMAIAAMPPAASQTPTPLDPAAITRGRTTFATYCAACHGPEGRGGVEGTTDLTRSPIATAADGGAQLSAFLKVGRPERGSCRTGTAPSRSHSPAGRAATRSGCCAPSA